MMEPVAWKWEEYFTEWGKDANGEYKHSTMWDDDKPADHPDIRDVTPLVRLSDAETRIAELEAENARHLAEIDRKSSMPGDYRYWEGRYRDAEALLNEAGPIIRQYIAKDEIEGVILTSDISRHRAARAIHHKIGVKDE